MSNVRAGTRRRYMLRCNGAPNAAPGRTYSGQYDLKTYGGENVVLRITDITDRLMKRLPPVVVDLLELAALVYAADQCCKRTPGRTFEYGARWHRFFRFEVAVRRPGFWNRKVVRDALCETLGFLSEDDYEFQFHDAEKAPSVQQYLDFGPGGAGVQSVDRVMLMSGGLDSLAGAAEQVIRKRLRLALVSHKPVEHLASRQRKLVSQLYGRAHRSLPNPFHVTVAAHKAGLAGEDFTQRSRSFLYACMGAAVADLFGLSEVWFYENGVTSVNLPLCGQEVGGRATRTTHPQALHGFGRILSLVFDRPFAVHNGFFWQTRQDVLEALKKYRTADLARVAVSCSHTRFTTSPAPHCGMCSQCLGRRVAALGAGLGEDDPPDGYRKDPLIHERTKDEERILAERFIGQARAVSRMGAVREFTGQYAGELSRVYPYLNMPTTEAAERLFELHLRHAEQVTDAVCTQSASHMQEHWRGLLPATSALAYAFGAPVPPRGEGQTRSRTGTVAEGDVITVNEETFTVSWRSRAHTFSPRAGQLFALLARLARRPSHRVWFDQLREKGDVWDDAKVEDVSIRGAVNRLKQELREGGLGDLAECISTGSFQRRPFAVLDPNATAAGALSDPTPADVLG